MKTKHLLAISGVLNVALLLGIIHYAHKLSDATKDRPVIEPSVQTSTRTSEPSPLPHFRTNIVRLDWRTVESPDYREYIKNLRAIGCPEETIRDIIIADVNQLFAAKAKERLGQRQEFQFWKAKSADYPAIAAERIQKQIELAKEKRAVLKELLGVEINDPLPLAEAINPINEKYSFLPKEKQQQMMDLEALYAAKMIERFGRISNPPPEKNPQYQQLLAEKEAEMTRILSPQEMEDYEVRYSRTADGVRRFLGDFEATEEEFRRIYRLQKGFEENYPSSDSAALSREQRDARVAALQLFKDQLRAELGEQRFYQYEHENGLQRSAFRKVAEEFSIPKESLYNALDVTWTSQNQAIHIRYDTGLSPEQREQFLVTLRQQAEADLNRLLGSDAFKAYLGTRPAWVDYFKP